MKKTILLILTFIFLGTHIAQATALPNSEAIFTTYPNNTTNQNKWIIEEANPGQSLKESIIVKNLTNNDISLNINFKETTGDEKNIKILETEKYQNIGEWINLPTKSIDLKGNESKQINFTINTPVQTKLGKYQGTLLVTYIDKENPSLNVATRIGNRIYLNITNNQDLQTNINQKETSIFQIALIIISSIGLLYGLTKNKPKTNV